MECVLTTPIPTKPKPKISMTLEWVDPARAEQLLGTITKQRALRRAHVAALSADMKHGRWHDSHQAIATDENGHLCDGQHRLTTIVETGIGQWLWVASGVPIDAMGVIDNAAIRSAADALKIGEVVDKNHPIVAATARIAILWGEEHHRKVRANTNGARKVTNSEISEWVEDQLTSTGLALNITQAVSEARTWTGITARTAMSPSVLAFALLMTASVDYADAFEFFTALDKQDFVVDNVGDPVHQLFDREQLALNNKEGLRISEHLFLIFTAWNAWRSQEDIKFVSTASGKLIANKRILAPRKNKAGVIIPLEVPDPI